MFIGHLAPVELLLRLAPATPPWVALTGTAFPDLLWGATILFGLERVEIDPQSPLQRNIRFTYYPYSHSLVLTNIIALVPALIIAVALGWVAGIVFLIASISHWLLDTIVHLPDLPVLGFGKDRKVGFGLWRNGPLAFAVEYGLVVVATLLFVPSENWFPVLGVALLFHLLNLNTFIAFTKDNPMKTPRAYAALTFVGFAAMVVVFNALL